MVHVKEPLDQICYTCEWHHYSGPEISIFSDSGLLSLKGLSGEFEMGCTVGGIHGQITIVRSDDPPRKFVKISVLSQLLNFNI